MALTTRAQVLQRLGLTDDATASVALIVSIASGSSSYAITVTSTTLTIVQDGITTLLSITLTDAAYDTIGEVATAINALSVLNCEVAAGLSSSTPSTLLVAGAYSIPLPTDDDVAQITYTNSASGTVAALIDSLIEETESAIARHCNRGNPTTGAQQFESAARDEWYSGAGQDVLRLRNYPVSSVSSVTVTSEDGTSTTTLASTDYRLRGESGLLYYVGSGLALGHPGSPAASGWPTETTTTGFPQTNRRKVGWPYGFQNIRVQYTGGYTTVPPDLRGVATDIVVDAYLSRRRDRSVSSESVSGDSATYRSVADMVEHRKAQLAPYTSYPF